MDSHFLHTKQSYVTIFGVATRARVRVCERVSVS